MMNRHTVSHGDQHGPGWDGQGGAITQNQGLASFVQERGVVHELTVPRAVLLVLLEVNKEILVCQEPNLKRGQSTSSWAVGHNCTQT